MSGTSVEAGGDGALKIEVLATGLISRPHNDSFGDRGAAPADAKPGAEDVDTNKGMLSSEVDAVDSVAAPTAARYALQCSLALEKNAANTPRVRHAPHTVETDCIKDGTAEDAARPNPRKRQVDEAFSPAGVAGTAGDLPPYMSRDAIEARRIILSCDLPPEQDVKWSGAPDTGHDPSEDSILREVGRSPWFMKKR
ncbi:uncharacterized protein UV8b_00275 [Ustilaginoidea virens]|uniref:Uncharacterized protein n=1 Tax=Ustilaginoidea virens TaxID=1159556 RepID=A0A8E5HJE5_USTVR|nr:uncharacterized protein UV8b_00275 [Ustilaginoidea virens]QUC16034.1 hypothetical protein UV8b_00275 [Ustilaginoidea virens]